MKTRKFSILILDDDKALCESIGELLETNLRPFMADMIMHRAFYPIEAINLIKNEIVDLVITDYNMPMMNGLEFQKEALGITFSKEQFPYFIHIGQIPEEKKIIAVKERCIGFFGKPIDTDRLSQFIVHIYQAGEFKDV